jgi:hypothetical protein
MVLKNKHVSRHNQLLSNNGDATKPETEDVTNRYGNKTGISCGCRYGFVRYPCGNAPNFSQLPRPGAKRSLACRFAHAHAFSTAGSLCLRPAY